MINYLSSLASPLPGALLRVTVSQHRGHGDTTFTMSHQPLQDEVLLYSPMFYSKSFYLSLNICIALTVSSRPLQKYFYSSRYP